MSHLLKSVEDGVMKITLNRPDAMNALSRDMMNSLTDALNEAAGSRDIGCVVVRGAGEKAFCAGGDVKSMAAGRDQDKTYEDKVHDIRIRMKVSELLHEMGKPTIAMVNGVAAGAGLSIALAADMRFVGKSARMTTAFAKVGFSGDFGSHYFLHKLVGTAKARELYFTAEILNADQIEKLGLANRVIDDANLENETVSQTGDFLFIPPGVPHEAINLSFTDCARAVVARNDPAEQDRVEPYSVNHIGS